MLDQENGPEQLIELSSLAEMIGFPKELLQVELFNENGPVEAVTLTRLREIVATYLDATILEVGCSAGESTN